MNNSVNIENPTEKFANFSDFSALSKALFIDQSLSLCLITSLQLALSKYTFFTSLIDFVSLLYHIESICQDKNIDYVSFL